MNYNSCEVVMVNGTRTHELGCPDSWQDYTRECKWCGSEFKPEDVYQVYCDEGCAEAYNS